VQGAGCRFSNVRHGVMCCCSLCAASLCYILTHPQEPNFTNYAQTRGDAPFIDTLDYVWLSEEWAVEEVQDLPHRDDMSGIVHAYTLLATTTTSLYFTYYISHGCMLHMNGWLMVIASCHAVVTRSLAAGVGAV